MTRFVIPKNISTNDFNIVYVENSVEKKILNT